MILAIVEGNVKLYSVYIANEKVEYTDNPIEITKEEALPDGLIFVITNIK